MAGRILAFDKPKSGYVVYGPSDPKDIQEMKQDYIIAVGWGAISALAASVLSQYEREQKKK